MRYKPLLIEKIHKGEITMSDFKKTERKPTMSISIDKDLRETLIRIAKREGISVSSVVAQTIRLAISNDLIKK